METEQSASQDVNRPCDNCRRGKRRCDGPQQPDHVCTRCTGLHKVCSYTEAFIPERLASQRCASRARVGVQSRLNVFGRQRRVPNALLMQELGSLAMHVSTTANLSVDGDDNAATEISSLETAEQWEDVIALSRQPHEVTSRDTHGAKDKTSTFRKRSAFWTVPTCEFRGERLEDRHFDPVLPPPDQLAPLVQAYFETWNTVLPAFHRPLFERQLLTVHETRDKHFMAALLLICALGEGRLAAEKQAVFDKDGPGWRFFVQVEPFLRVPTPANPQLLDVQIYYLAALFMTFNQLAFQARAHKRSSYRQRQPNLQDELWKRTFWSLLVTDRMTSYVYGRPTLIKDESFDLELPLDVDDARWDLSAPGHPLCGPSISEDGTCSFFVWHIRLVLILGVSVETLYSNNRSRLLMGFVGADWEQRITTHFDKLLHDWVTNVPSYLRWDPDATDLRRFIESSLLNAKYYSLRIMTHNPFIRTTARDFTRKSHTTTAGLDPQSSLEICTQAALECSDIMMVVVERYSRCLALPGWIDPPFVCGLILLVNLFGFKEHLPAIEVERYATYVRVCLDVLQVVATTHKPAIQRWETLLQLVSGLDQELPPSLQTVSAPPMFRPRSRQAGRWPENPTVPWSPRTLPGPIPYAAPLVLTSLQHPTEGIPYAWSSSHIGNPSHPFNIKELPSDLTDWMSTGLPHSIRPYPLLDAGDMRVQPPSTLQ
ncbi:hypothetical protein BKA62DRAFT_682594 [Auriculariales sp. MPI-PUGE-AT-0066]|nr:hypothetical protein BKA62DRAFT_682594 [Auriculariales sp. MPI-PUGE-AT-0066]